jgi:hypothetical protein
MISGIFSISRFSMPMRMVTVDDGQLPHAPLSLSFTTSPSISTSSTSPPSAMRYGRTSSEDLLHVVGGELELLGD